MRIFGAFDVVFAESRIARICPCFMCQFQRPVLPVHLDEWIDTLSPQIHLINFGEKAADRWPIIPRIGFDLPKFFDLLLKVPHAC